MKRHMSLHVGSRWYRAPEICLVEKYYDQSADLWSMGTIIYELLMYLQYQLKDKEQFARHFKQDRYLFQGNSCFPLSPCSENTKKKNEVAAEKAGKPGVHVISKSDQIKVILKELGEQNDESLSFLTSEHAISYIRELEQANASNLKKEIDNHH